MELNLNDKQIIVYGAPGTGKSYSINKAFETNNVDRANNVFRVVFYHDYSYSDFIGYISPKGNDDTVDYDFSAGPFTLALQRAFETDDTVCLLIEEVNRGNCAAIFGDIFQLLDRNKYGYSQYSIANSIIRNFLNKSNVIKEKLTRLDIAEDDIVLPPNFIIVGTMNTADQNVFTMDSAFKRRFKMKYLPIAFNEESDELKRLDELSKINIFAGKSCWSEFAQKINSIIDSINSEMLTVSEDKKLGPYFVDEVDVSSRQTFCDKVIYYLKNDVFKYSPQYLSDSYERLYQSFVIDETDIYKLLTRGEQ